MREHNRTIDVIKGFAVLLIIFHITGGLRSSGRASFSFMS